MVTRIGHIALRVPDLDAAVDFQREVIGTIQTKRTGSVSYMTCNERHHELILIQDPVRRGDHHIGSEVPDPQVLESMKSRVTSAGGRLLCEIYEGEEGSTARCWSRPPADASSAFCGMEQTRRSTRATARSSSSTTFSVKVRNIGAFERFLKMPSCSSSSRTAWG